MKQKTIYIKNLYIQKKIHIKQLKLLVNFRNEYIYTLTNKLHLGICIDQWKIYNNFIYMLSIVVEENRNIVKKYEKTIKNNIDQWFKNHIKLKTWNYLNQKNKTVLKNRQIIEENIITDEFFQFNFLKKR